SFFLYFPFPHSSTSFPYTTLFRSWSTRRSALRDIETRPWWGSRRSTTTCGVLGQWCRTSLRRGRTSLRRRGGRRRTPGGRGRPSSEEHTSELQSRFDLVCRILLAK